MGAVTAVEEASRTGSESQSAKGAKLSCRSIWKIFGRNETDRGFDAAEFSRLSAEEAQARGLVAAVRDVSLDIAPGEIFIVMGLSGSGKSTLLRCLARLVEPSSGAVHFEGRDLLQAGEAELIELRRHKMGMVFQHFALLPHLTVIDNIAFPLAIQKSPRPEREARAREMIELVGLKGRERAFPRELSGGQQQRVGIARSLATDPELWFLDEPFSALDPLIRREMQAELLRLQKLLHKTILFVTHDFDEAIRLADRIAIMKDGAIQQIGSPEDLVLAPANAYVAEFTREIDRAKVVTLGRIAQPSAGGVVAGTLPAKRKIADAAAAIIGAGQAFAVADEEGRPLGEVTPDAVIAALIDRGARG